MTDWAARQFRNVMDRFREDCPAEAWDDLLLRYAVLKSLGPQCGSTIAKKLVNAKGIWELVGHADNHQPRPLFYFREQQRQIVFVHAFMKKGKQDYAPAIKLAQDRRRLIERGEKPANVIPSFDQRPH